VRDDTITTLVQQLAQGRDLLAIGFQKRWLRFRESAQRGEPLSGDAQRREWAGTKHGPVLEPRLTSSQDSLSQSQLNTL